MAELEAWLISERTKAALAGGWGQAWHPNGAALRGYGSATNKLWLRLKRMPSTVQRTCGPSWMTFGPKDSPAFELLPLN